MKDSELLVQALRVMEELARRNTEHDELCKGYEESIQDLRQEEVRLNDFHATCSRKLKEAHRKLDVYARDVNLILTQVAGARGVLVRERSGKKFKQETSITLRKKVAAIAAFLTEIERIAEHLRNDARGYSTLTNLEEWDKVHIHGGHEDAYEGPNL